MSGSYSVTCRFTDDETTPYSIVFTSGSGNRTEYISVGEAQRRAFKAAQTATRNIERNQT